MTTMTQHGRGWRFTFDRNIQPVDASGAWDKSWRFVDAVGHEHFYEDGGFPTLREVIDRSHWCDGNEGICNHDPHLQIDNSHFVCGWCGETITPGKRPIGSVDLIEVGPPSAVLEGYLDEGTWIRVHLLETEATALINAGDLMDDTAHKLLELAPPERISERRWEA